MPRELDFPRTALPGVFHYVGPLRRPHPRAIEFPWERLDGRPMVYASLGTLQNRRAPLFRCFAEACAQLNVQLVIAHGGGLTSDDAAKLPGRPLVVRYAPQLDVLARARLTITHGGLNTVLDSLASGVPIVTIPLTYEQPAIARRVEWTGSGQSIPLRVLKPARLARTMLRVLRRPEYQEAAQRLRKDIIASGGVARATDILETTLKRS